MKIAALVIASALLAGCSSSADGGATEVDWSKYEPSVKKRIDRLKKQGNCARLQQEFDAAVDNNDAQRKRTGEGNDDLMAYLDGLLEKAGCY